MKDEILESKQSPQPVEFIVPHTEAMGLKFICVVKAQVADPALNDDSRFLDGLRRATTFWINGTDRGKAAWKESCEDFNIGDLGNEFPLDEELKNYLAAEGIFDLQLASYGGGCRHWVHDTCLVNVLNLDEEEEDSEEA